MKDLLISCEHGGYDIPSAYQKYFEKHKAKLRTHAGWDPGSLELAKYFNNNLQATFFYSTISRLLIEQNRTLTHPELFSEISQDFTEVQKNKLKQEVYLPYLNQLEQFIENKRQAKHSVLHLSVHSFTPVLAGVRRDAEIGILFDPASESEQHYAQLWMHSIQEKMPHWSIKFNYPYLGTDDGLTSYFRTKFAQNYAGIELEVNNRLFTDYSFERLGTILMPPKI